jgi:hypothetical protein
MYPMIREHRRPGVRRQRSARLAVESIEERLAPSSIFLSPSPHPAEFVILKDSSSPPLARSSAIVTRFQPPAPC